MKRVWTRFYVCTIVKYDYNYTDFFYVSVLMMGRAIAMSRGSLWFLSRQIIDNVKKEIIITFQFRKII